MNPQFLYRYDPMTLEFEAEIQERMQLTDGRLGVILTQTYFYPTGGGQAHDTGSLGNARVMEVVRSDDGKSVIHILDGDPGTGKLTGVIDRDRRLRHMQHHTAQHLISGCFQQVFNLETLSSGIHGYEPTTIDLPDTDLSRADLDSIEDLANQIVYENRAVNSYFVSVSQIHKVPLRRPPKVNGKVRIVEIDGFDYAACGATHCPHTGMIGLIKIIRTERINQKTRIHLVAGIQAMAYFRQYQETTTTLAGELSAHPEDVVTIVNKQTGRLHEVEKELRQLRLGYSAIEAQELLVNAEEIGEHIVIMKSFKNRPADEIRSLGNELKAQVGVISLLATFDGKKLVLVATCSPDSSLSARDLLNRQLAAINGRGGGDDQIAQGGGAATEQQFSGFFEHTRDLLQ